MRGGDAENPWIFDVLRQTSVDVHCLLDDTWNVFIEPVQQNAAEATGSVVEEMRNFHSWLWHFAEAAQDCEVEILDLLVVFVATSDPDELGFQLIFTCWTSDLV